MSHVPLHKCVLGHCLPFSISPAFLSMAHSANTVRPKQIRLSYSAIYQFQLSSSSSFSSLVDVCGDVDRPDTATTSGSMTRPRAVLPVSSSSSSSDCAGGAHAGATLAVDAGASAEKIDCDTSERISEARFWLLENLDKQRTKATSAPGAHTGEHILFCFTHVSPLCNSTNLDPTESTQPCAASPRLARPSPIALSGLIGADVGEAALTRFPEPECESSPVSALSASASGACESRDRRRRTLLEGDCNFISPESRAMTSSRWLSSLPESVFTSATDDMDDCERRGLPAALGTGEVVVVVVVVVVEETEFDAA